MASPTPDKTGRSTIRTTEPTPIVLGDIVRTHRGRRWGRVGPVAMAPAAGDSAGEISVADAITEESRRRIRTAVWTGVTRDTRPTPDVSD
jgi:hypothetical protein